MLNLTGIENHKKLLSLLNSPPSLCVEYKISSKLKHLPFFVQNFQNYGLTEDRCIYWHVSILTDFKNYKKTIVSIEFTTLDLCKERNFFKTDAFATLRPKLWHQRWQCQHWQVSRITNNYFHRWIQHLHIVYYAKFCGKWLTSFPVPRSPF